MSPATCRNGVIAARRDPGRKPYVIGLLDQADPASFSRPPDVWIRLGQAGKGVRLLKSAGDQIGGGLIAALREATGGKLEIAGIGGEAMSAEGLESLFPIEELAVMGLVEVLLRAFSIMRQTSETAETIGRLSPDAVVTIDAPPFAKGLIPIT